MWQVTSSFQVFRHISFLGTRSYRASADLWLRPPECLCWNALPRRCCAAAPWSTPPWHAPSAGRQQCAHCGRRGPLQQRECVWRCRYPHVCSVMRGCGNPCQPIHVHKASTVLLLNTAHSVESNQSCQHPHIPNRFLPGYICSQVSIKTNRRNLLLILTNQLFAHTKHIIHTHTHTHNFHSYMFQMSENNT